MYGNYDGKNQLPNFDLYLGANYWDSIDYEVGTDDASSSKYSEIIHTPSSDYIHVCLVNTGFGTPFISVLELRPLSKKMYETEFGSLHLHVRADIGSTSTQLLRYKDDKYDRIWVPFVFNNGSEIKTALDVIVPPENTYQPPNLAMRTASAAVNSSSPLQFYIPANITDQFYFYFHFAEVEVLQGNQSRELNVYLNGDILYGPLQLTYLMVQTWYTLKPQINSPKYEFTFVKTQNSTHPPIINAFEAYKVKQLSHPETDGNDMNAILAIKSTYGITRNWQGDPCAPQAYVWDGLNCRTDGSNPLRIISMNLSSSGLTGTITPYISNLTMLQTLDLSYNNLTGEVPAFLSQLPSLSVLDLEGNNFTGPIPAKLLQMASDGRLTMRVDGLDSIPNSCKNGACGEQKKKNKSKIIVPIVASAVAASLILVIIASTVLSTRGEAQRRPK